MKGEMNRALRRLLEAVILVPSVAGLMLAPSALNARGYRRRSMCGVVTVEDAVRACRERGLHGWELVAYAQRLVGRKFVYYSLRNLWDTPARAFSYGMGYCSQYNLALKQILEALGFAVKAVYCTQVCFVDRPAWRLGHTWLRVEMNGEWRDVCASRPGNYPGIISFEPLRPVRRGNAATLLLMHLGMILYFGLIEWRVLLTREPLPSWLFEERA